MTVAALPPSISYFEDGVSTVFPVPYRFKAPADLVVERIIEGDVTVLSLGTDYSVVGGDTDAGGTLTRTTATSGAMLRITRDTPRSQPMDYTTGDRFPAESHEQALDRAMLIDQEQDVGIGDVRLRAVLVPPGEVGQVLPPRAQRVGGRKKVLGVDRDTGDLKIQEIDEVYRGDTGPADNTYTSIAELRASDPTRKAASLVGAAGVLPGRYYWETANAPYTDDGVITITPNGAIGAWVRDQRTTRSAMEFGAGLGAGIAADTAGLANMLALRGEMNLPPATYNSGARQVLQSGSTLRLYPGATLRQGPGINNNLICNAAYLAPWSLVTGNVFWTAGTYEVLITWANHGCVVGDFVWLSGADQGAYLGVFPVVEVVNASNIRIRLKRRPAANPTGVLSIKKADRDIVVDMRGGVLDYNQPQNSDSTPGPQTHCMLFAGVHNLTIVGARFANTKKFGLCLGAVAGFRVIGIAGWGLISDLLKIYGPAWDGLIDGVEGYPGDDFISLQCKEPDAFAAYRFSEGDIFNIAIRNVTIGRGDNGSGVMTSIYPTPEDRVIDNILLENYRGHSNFYGVQVFDYAGGGTIGRLAIRNFNAACSQPVRVAANVGSTTIKQLSVDFGPNAHPITGADFIEIAASAVTDRLTISGDIDNAGVGAGALLNVAGQVRSLVFDRLRYKVNALFMVSWSGAPKLLETCTFTACDVDVTGTMFRGAGVSFSANPTISVDGGELKSLANLFEVASTMTVSFNGVRLAPGSQAVTAIGGTAPIVTINTSGSPLLSGDWAAATIDAKINPRSPDISLNLNASWINRATGNFLTTPAATGTGGATDIQAGAMAFCQGTAAGSWKQLSDASRSF